MSSEALRAEAREWQVLLHSGRASAADHARARAWRLQSAEHEQAAREVEALWALLGQAAAGSHSASTVARLPRQRVPRWSLPLASAALLLLALWLPPHTWLRWYADLATAPGEIRRVQLEDGSVVTLNGATALDWSMDGQRREVRLYRGEADFQVARDGGRPFFVLAGPARIRVTGTRFDVDYRDEQVVLAVTEGRVEAGDGHRSPRQVLANQQVRWHGEALQATTALDARQQLAWQRGKLVFRAQPLSEVFARLRNSQGARVLFLDGQVKALKVTGVFAHDDPESVLRAIESNLPVRILRLPGLLLVSGN